MDRIRNSTDPREASSSRVSWIDHPRHPQEVKEPSKVEKLEKLLDIQKARFNELRCESDLFPNISTETQNLIKDLNNMKLSDSTTIDDKRSFIDKYTTKADELERSNLKTQLEQQQARSDKSLQESSIFSSKTIYYTFINDFNAKIPDNNSNIPQLKEFLKQYTYITDSLEIATINEPLSEQRVRAGNVLKDFSNLSSEEITRLEQFISDNAQNPKDFDGKSIEDKRAYVKEYISHIDKLENEYLAKSLDIQKARVDQLLSYFPNTSEEFKMYNSFKKSMEEEIPANGSTIDKLNGFVQDFTLFADGIEVITRRSPDAQKARIDQLLQELSRLPNANETFAEFADSLEEKTIEKRLDAEKARAGQLRQELSRPPSTSEALEGWNQHLQKTEDKVLNCPTIYIKRSNIGEYTSFIDGLEKQNLNLHAEYTSSVDQLEQQLNSNPTAHTWQIDLRNVQISRWTQVRKYFLTKQVKDTRPSRADRANKIADDINKELKDIGQVYISKDLSSDRTNEIIKQIIHNEIAIKKDEIAGHYTRAFNDKDRDVRTKDEILLHKQLKDLKNIKERYLANQILPVESGISTLMKELTGQYKISYEESKGPIKNEDAYIQDRVHSIYGVFDGMGGYGGGDIASKKAEEFIQGYMRDLPDNMSLDEMKNKMKEILIGAHKEIEKEQENSNFKDMGTTASVVKIMQDGTAVIGNVGDSRVYLLREGSQAVEHLTLDDSGFKYNFEVYGNPDNYDFNKIQKDIAQLDTFGHKPTNIPLMAINERNSISQALGYAREDVLTPNIYTHQLAPGDRLIIMSDGIHDNLTDQKIADCLLQNPHDTQKATKALVQKAKEVSEQGTSRSKSDDMTAIVVKWS